MKRWFYILLGGLGVGLAAAAVFMLWLAPTLPPPYPTPVMVAEIICIPLGLALSLIGVMKGRDAAEFDVAHYVKSGRKRRDHHVDGGEVNFECPICHKRYHASPLLIGRPFACRACNQIFDVPATAG